MPSRRRPEHGVITNSIDPVIVFVTVCTKNRVPWLPTQRHHELLRDVWMKATAWLVGRYVLLPYHLHMFVAPGAIDVTLEAWISYWKSQFTKQNGSPDLKWQSGHWDTRLRRGQSYDEKWNYVL